MVASLLIFLLAVRLFKDETGNLETPARRSLRCASAQLATRDQICMQLVMKSNREWHVMKSLKARKCAIWPYVLSHRSRLLIRVEPIEHSLGRHECMHCSQMGIQRACLCVIALYLCERSNAGLAQHVCSRRVVISTGCKLTGRRALSRPLLQLHPRHHRRRHPPPPPPLPRRPPPASAGRRRDHNH